jgi:hypothetical protein
MAGEIGTLEESMRERVKEAFRTDGSAHSRRQVFATARSSERAGLGPCSERLPN